MEVYANLTETIHSPTPCERSTCKAVIQPGEDRFYIRNKKNPDKPGKYVCLACFHHYESGTGTVIRTTSSQKQPTISVTTLSSQDISAIRRDVNESQRQGGHTSRGRVTALPQSQTSSNQVGPGPLVANPQYVYGSMINGQFVPQPPPVMATTQGPTQMAPPAQPIVGYSSAHVHHAQQTKNWSQMAYRGSAGGNPSHIIHANLEIYQPEMDKKGDPIRIAGIKESLSVAVNISHHSLYNAIKNELRNPFVNYLNENQVTTTDDVLARMVARETTKGLWIRVEPDNHVPFFDESRFFTPPKKKSDLTATFKPPSKPLLFGWVIPTRLWAQICNSQEVQYMKSLENSMQPAGTKYLPTNLSIRQQPKRTRKAKLTQVQETISHQSEPEFDTTSTGSEESLPERVEVPKKPRYSSYETRPNSKACNNNLDTIGTSKRPIEIGSDSETQTHSHLESNSQRRHTSSSQKTSKQLIQAWSHGPGDSGARTASHPSRPSRPESLTPSQSSHRPTMGSTQKNAGSSFVPLEVDSISRAFQQGGTSTGKMKPDGGKAGQLMSESILFFPLPEYTLKEIIDNPQKVTNSIVSIIPEENLHFHAHLVYNPDPKMRLGKGTFKTAISAVLEFDGSRRPTSGLGSSGSSLTPVALKRPFIETPIGPAKLQRKESRLSYAEEHKAILGEAKLLVWAKALLKYSYNFIHSFVDNTKISNEDLPGFIRNIPLFSFVEAGTAIATKAVDSVGESKIPTSNRASYLLEEMLPGDRIDFVKYINNSRAVSLLQPDEPDYNLAEFLVFIQHVQFQVTHRMAYISDFQGVNTTLTDPQIMTCPKLGSRLFGDGNVGNAFERFPDEHECNRYCEWFSLEELKA